MTITASTRRWLIAAGFSLAGLALGQEGPRPARLSHLEGSLAFAAAGEQEWLDTAPKRPLQRGDRLWLDARSRGELQLGTAAVRLAGPVQVGLRGLDSRTAQLTLTQGAVHARLRELKAGENFEVDTPNLAFRATQPGLFRVDVDPARALTRITVHSGAGVAYGQGGQATAMTGGQQLAFTGKDLAQVRGQRPDPDGFDRWALERDRGEAQAAPARVTPGVVQAKVPARAPDVAAQPAAKPREAPSAEERERARREAWQREQQALTERWKREHAAWQRKENQRGQQDGIPILRQR